MKLPRVHLFEANDAAWVPDVVREGVVETLTETLRRGGILDGLAPIFADFVSRANVTEVLDLCAGAGAPAQILADRLRAQGVTPPRIVMTDLHPRVASWQKLRDSSDGTLDFVSSPVDATAIPDAVSRGRARMIINAFHHLPEPLARGVLADAVAQRAPLLVVESFDRNPFGSLPFARRGVAALWLNPLFAQRRRVARAALTWGVPVIPLVGMWDSFASTWRIYDDADLDAMTAGFRDYVWEHRSWTFPWGGRGRAFSGVPVA